MPSAPVQVDVLLGRQVVVAQHDSGPAVLLLQRDDDAGAAGRDGVSVRPPQGEDEAVRWVDLQKLAHGLDPVRTETRYAPPGTGSSVAWLPIYCACRAGSVR